MSLPISVTYTFATATSAIPLSQLDANFTTVVNGINGIGNGTNALANVNITGGNITGLSTAIPIASGGTGLTTTPSNGQIDIGNGTGFTRTTLTAGTNITITNGGGSITISSTGGSSGVTSISFGSTGLTPSTSTTGAVTVSGTLAVTSGGTGITSPGISGNVLVSNGTAWVSGSVAALAWLNYNASTQTIRASYNVSSVTYISTGNYKINFSNALSDANYVVSGSTAGGSGGSSATTWLTGDYSNPRTTSAVWLTYLTSSGGAFYDQPWVNIAIFGN